MKYILTTFLLLFSIYVSAQCGTVDVQQIGALTSPSASNVSLSVSYIKNATNIAPSSDNDISVLWSTGETTDQIDNLGSGLYSVTVTDAVEDCSVIEKVTVSYVASPETNGGEVTAANISATNQVCAEANSGTIGINITSGVAPYDIYLTHQQSGYGGTGYLTNNSTFTFIGLAPGDYDITVVNANGYATEFTAIVLADNLSSGIETLSEPLCYGGTGSVKAIVYDGVEEVVDVSDYSFLWSNGATTQTLTDVPAGVYTVTVTKNSTSCDYESPTHTLRQPNQLNLSVTSIQEASTYQSNDGNIVMTTTGGTTADGFYDYTWSDGFINNGVISSTNNNLTPGTYEITVTDDNGCTDEELVILGPNPPSNLLGNAGILHTSGDPDKIYLVGVQEDLRTESMLAIDTITSNVYIYKANDPVGSKWDLLSANGIFDNQDDEIQSILLDTLTYTDSIGIALTLDEQYKFFPKTVTIPYVDPDDDSTNELQTFNFEGLTDPKVKLSINNSNVHFRGGNYVKVTRQPGVGIIDFNLDTTELDLRYQAAGGGVFIDPADQGKLLYSNATGDTLLPTYLNLSTVNGNRTEMVIGQGDELMVKGSGTEGGAYILFDPLGGNQMRLKSQKVLWEMDNFEIRPIKELTLNANAGHVPIQLRTQGVTSLHVGSANNGRRIGFNTDTPRSDFDINHRGSMIVPSGLTNERQDTIVGMLRHSLEKGKFEVVEFGTQWSNLATEEWVLNGGGGSLWELGDNLGDVVLTSGKVGIGLTAPERTLHLKATTSAIEIESTDFGSSATARLYTKARGYGGMLFNDDSESLEGLVQYGHAANELFIHNLKQGPIIFSNDHVSPYNGEVMRIASNGNVGIGAGTAPAYPLDVGGDKAVRIPGGPSYGGLVDPQNGVLRVDYSDPDYPLLQFGHTKPAGSNERNEMIGLSRAITKSLVWGDTLYMGHVTPTPPNIADIDTFPAQTMKGMVIYDDWNTDGFMAFRAIHDGYWPAFFRDDLLYEVEGRFVSDNNIGGRRFGFARVVVDSTTMPEYGWHMNNERAYFITPSGETNSGFHAGSEPSTIPVDSAGVYRHFGVRINHAEQLVEYTVRKLDLNDPDFSEFSVFHTEPYDNTNPAFPSFAISGAKNRSVQIVGAKRFSKELFGATPLGGGGGGGGSPPDIAGFGLLRSAGTLLVNDAEIATQVELDTKLTYEQDSAFVWGNYSDDNRIGQLLVRYKSNGNPSLGSIGPEIYLDNSLILDRNTSVIGAGASYVGPLVFEHNRAGHGFKFNTAGDVAAFSFDQNSATFHGTGATKVHAGTTLDRPATNSLGQLRGNSDSLSLEFNDGLGWRQLAFKDEVAGNGLWTQTGPDAITYSGSGGSVEIVQGSLPTLYMRNSGSSNTTLDIHSNADARTLYRTANGTLRGRIGMDVTRNELGMTHYNSGPIRLRSDGPINLESEPGVVNFSVTNTKITSKIDHVFDTKIGIGTTAPTSPLDVNGTARIRSLPVGAATGLVGHDSLGNLISTTAGDTIFTDYGNKVADTDYAMDFYGTTSLYGTTYVWGNIGVVNGWRSFLFGTGFYGLPATAQNNFAAGTYIFPSLSGPQAKHNTGFGADLMNAYREGNNNTLFGSDILEKAVGGLTTGGAGYDDGNFAAGFLVGNNVRRVKSSVLIGGRIGPYQAGRDTTMYHTIALGEDALYDAYEADSIVALGYRAGVGNTHKQVTLVGLNTAATQEGEVVLGNYTVGGVALATRLTSGKVSFATDIQPTDGQGLVYSAADGEYVPGNSSGGGIVSTFSTLSSGTLFTGIPNGEYTMNLSGQGNANIFLDAAGMVAGTSFKLYVYGLDAASQFTIFSQETAGVNIIYQGGTATDQKAFTATNQVHHIRFDGTNFRIDSELKN